ncbi:MAG: lysylphosphatidylglycerol synthase transmembrane domain-containing protein [Rubricoccaceae bacterium]|nr:lysylphosphatidylglycerol synthase transmembrane domain-containing protein [Rubricoccaceae bacterium]
MQISPETLPEKGRKTAFRTLLIPIALSVGVLGLVVVLTYEPGTFTTMARAFHPAYLAAAIGALGGQLALGGLRMQYISHHLVPFRKGVRAQLAWDFMSAVTPSAVGGAPLASFFVAKDNNLPVGQATSIMLFSMLLDQLWFAFTIPAILLATIQFDIFPPSLGQIGAGTLTVYFLVMLVWVGFFAYATLVRPEIVQRVIEWVSKLKWLRRYEGRVAEEMQRLKDQAKVLRGEHPLFFLNGFLYSAGVWMCRYLVILFIVMSVVPALPVVDFLLRTGAMWLTALIIPTPGGSGGIEGLYVLFLDPLIPNVFTGPTLVTWRLLAYHLFIVLGLFVTSGTVSSMIQSGRRVSEEGSAIQAEQALSPPDQSSRSR